MHPGQLGGVIGTEAVQAHHPVAHGLYWSAVTGYGGDAIRTEEQTEVTQLEVADGQGFGKDEPLGALVAGRMGQGSAVGVESRAKCIHQVG